MIRFKTLILFVFLFNLQGLQAMPQSSPLPYKRWKQIQINDAKNQVIRIKNRIHLIETGQLHRVSPDLSKKSEKGQGLATTARARKSQGDELSHLERSLRVARQNLTYSRQLGIEDYVEIYLTSYKDDPMAIRKAAKNLSVSEVQLLLQSIVAQKKL